MPNNTVESIKKIILNAVQKASGWPTIFAPADGPTPANQYCLVTLKSIEKFEHDVINIAETETALTETQRSESQLTFEIQARGKDHMTVMDNIVSYFDSSMRDIDLWGKIGSGGHDDIQDISTYLNGKILPVSVLNIYIHTALQKENSLDWMNYIDITSKIDDNDSITITVPQQEE